MIVFPDATSLADVTEFHNLYINAMTQCAVLKDRFTIVDIFDGDLDFQAPGVTDIINSSPDGFRNKIGTDNLKYGAAYYPWLKTIYSFFYNENEVQVTGGSIPANSTLVNETDAQSLILINNALYNQIKAEITNVSLNAVIEPLVNLDNDAQDDLNVHPTGKSVNAIRVFTGKGIMVWGARTLAGNDNEWRYVSVRRFFNMVEESVKKATEPFVFEPNDANTWVKVRAMIENFLILQWREGALAGASPEDAFFVKVGLGETMTALDILEGRMNVEIGMAVVRPAEFIILKFSHKMQES
jgi:uncharacterized protein